MERLAERIGRALERQGVLARWGTRSPTVWRSARAPGRRCFRCRPGRGGESKNGVAQHAGFSLNAGIGVHAEPCEKLERLTRYVSRPPVSVERLDLTAQGQVRYRLKTPYRDGTTHIVLNPLDFIARLAALVPPPRTHLTRFHGVFAAHATLRAAITPAGRGAGAQERAAAAQRAELTPKDIRMNWAAPKARVRERAVRALRRALASDCEHRGAGAHRTHSRAPARARRGGGADGRAWTACAAAAVAILIG